MADNYDASIEINSRIDTGDFKKGAKEIERETNALEKKINQSGKAMESFGKIDTSGSRKELESLSASAERAASKINEAIKSAEDTSNAKKIIVPGEVDADKFENGSERMNRAIESLKTKASDVGGLLKEKLAGIFAGIKIDAPKVDIENAEKASTSLIEKTEGLKDASSEAGASISDSYKAAKSEVDELAKSLDAAQEKADDLDDAFVAREDYSKAFDDAKKYSKLSDEYKNASEERKSEIQEEAGIKSVPGEDYFNTLENAATKAEEKMDELRRDFEDTSAYKEVQAEIQSIEAKLEEAEARAEDFKSKLDSQAESIKGPDSSEIDAAGNAFESATEKAEKFEQAERSASEVKIESPAAFLDSHTENLLDIGKSIIELESLAKSALDGDKDALQQFDQKSIEVRQNILSIRNELDNFGKTQFETDAHKQLASDYEKATEEVRNLSKALEEAESKAESLERAFVTGDEYQNTKADIKKYQDLEAQYRAAENDPSKQVDIISQAGIKWKGGDYADALKRAADEAIKKRDELEQEFSQSNAFQKAQNHIISIENELDAATEKASAFKDQLDSSGNTSYSGYDTEQYAGMSSGLDGMEQKLLGIVKTVESAQSPFKILGSVAASAGKKIGSIAFESIKNGLAGIAKSAQQAASNLARMAKNAAVSSLKKLGSTFIGIGKGSDDMGKSMKKSFWTLMKYGLGIRSLFVLFRKLKSALKEGLGELMKFDPQLATAVNNFKASLATLRNAFASALAPIISLVLPYITRFIDMITNAVSRIGMLIAALTGGKSFIKATKQQTAATDAAAGSLGKEAKAAKEAQKTIAGFDDITILQDNDDNDAGGGGGGGGGLGGGFEEVPIDDKMGDWAKKLKEMWEKADFTELGRMLGEKLRDALNKIPWDIIKDFARRLAKSIATFLNGFLEVPGLFDAVGRTIAQALNTAFEFVNAFARAFHWDSLGYAIRDGILGILNNLDWGVIYSAFMAVGTGIGTALEAALDNPEIWTAVTTTFARQVTALVLAIQGFFGAVNWGSIGHNIGLGINEGVDAFPWLGIADTITTALNSAFDLIYNFLTTVDFYKIGSHVGQMLTEAITTFDWGTAGASFAALINGLFNIINGFVVDTDWRSLASGIIDAIKGFFGEFDWASAGNTVGNVVIGLFSFLNELMGSVDWVLLPFLAVKKIEEFLAGINWIEVLTQTFTLLVNAVNAIVGLITGAGGAILLAGTDIILGLLKGIGNGMLGIAAWINEHVVQPFIDGVKNFFGIASPSKEMESIGGFIVEGLLNGILAPLKNIFGWLSEHVGGPIVNGVKTLFGIGSGEPALEGSGKGLVEGLKDGMGDVISSVGGWIKNNVTDPVSNAVKDHFGTDHTAVTQEDGKGLVEGLKTGMGNVMSGMAGWIKSNVTDPVAKTITTNLGTDRTAITQEYGQKLIEGFKTGMEIGMKDMERYISSSVTDPMLNAVREQLGISGKSGESAEFTDIGENIIESLKKAVDDNSRDVISSLEELAEAMPEPFKEIDWHDIGVYICEGIADGIESRWDWLENKAYNLAIDVYNAACRALDISSPSKKFYWIAEMVTAGLSNGIEDTSGDAVDAVSATAKALTEEAESASPIIPIETALDDPLSRFDSTMYEFADKVVGGFEAMISALQDIASQAAFSIPQAALGSVVPYTSRATAYSGRSSMQDQDAFREYIEAIKSDMLTRDDLEEILENVAREHFNFDFYIGNEQVARAANAGNARLNRRFKPSKA